MISEGFCIWFTGLPCSGKTTLSKILSKRLSEKGYKVLLLDGDDIRSTISSDLGFDKRDRFVNILRAATVASEGVKNRSVVICALVSPYEEARRHAMDLIGKDRFILVYLKTPLSVCEQRDVKGMYARARKGEIKGFTGVDDPYEPPACPDLAFDTSEISPEDITIRILDFLSLRGLVFDPLSSIDIIDIIQTAKEAGEKILEVYRSPFDIKNKEDNSPLTMADCLSHKVISERLRDLYPAIPILSEEGRDISYETRRKWQCFWLIDPLDGTKEFIKRNGDFAVNIALIFRNRPVLGVIYLPVKNEAFFAVKGKGAFKMTDNGNFQSIKVNEKPSDDGLRVVTSRSHHSKELDDYLGKIKIKEILSLGSSLKFCLVAEGKADVYPRLGPTMEWDSAAGQIIVEEAGGDVSDFFTRKPLTYNKEVLENPPFLVKGGHVTLP